MMVDVEMSDKEYSYSLDKGFPHNQINTSYNYTSTSAPSTFSSGSKPSTSTPSTASCPTSPSRRAHCHARRYEKLRYHSQMKKTLGVPQKGGRLDIVTKGLGPRRNQRRFVYNATVCRFGGSMMRCYQTNFAMAIAPSRLPRCFDIPSEGVREISSDAESDDEISSLLSNLSVENQQPQQQVELALLDTSSTQS